LPPLNFSISYPFHWSRNFLHTIRVSVWSSSSTMHISTCL
jgi:hypothetical protein